jgi:hypothetical protein
VRLTAGRVGVVSQPTKVSAMTPSAKPTTLRKPDAARGRPALDDAWRVQDMDKNTPVDGVGDAA